MCGYLCQIMQQQNPYKWRKMGDSDKDSEFDSEIEEIENQMYAHLYFIDTTPDTTVPQHSLLSNSTTSDNASQNAKNGKGPECLLAKDEDIIVTGERLKPVVDVRLAKRISEIHQDCDIIEVTTLCNKLTPENIVPSTALNAKGKKSESSVLQKDVNDYIPLQLSITINNDVSKPCSRKVTETKFALKHNSDSKRKQDNETRSQSINPLPQVSLAGGRQSLHNQRWPPDRNSSLPEGKRRRMSSVCSVDSISGSKPLDELYLCDSSENSDSLDFSMTLAMSKMEEELKKDFTNACISKDTQRGKKRREESESSDDDDDDDKEEEEMEDVSAKADSSKNSKKLRKIEMEESRGSDDEKDSKCNEMIKIKKKEKKITQDSDAIILEETSTDSDSSVYVLAPPEKKPCEMVTLEDSDEEDSCRKNSSSYMAEKTGSVKPKAKEACSTQTFKERKEPSSDDSSSEFEEDLDQSQMNLSMNIDSRLADTLEKMSNKHNQTESLNPGKDRTGFLEILDRNQNMQQGTLKQTQASSCPRWTAEMVAFYNMDVGEDLHVLDVHKKQSDLPQYWKIRSEDLPNKQKRRYFMKEVRCLRCRQFGHLKNECQRVPHCHLCSETTHTARHLCPKNCCFRCGKGPHMICPDTFEVILCKVCGSRGHKSYLCPDYWRRYHLTTEGSNPIQPLEPQYRPLVEAWCFICAKKGHFGYQCPQRHLNKCHIPVSHIISSYECPAVRKDNNQAHNTENMDPEKGIEEEGPLAVTILPVKQEDGIRLTGNKGNLIKALQAKTQCTISFVNDADHPQLRIYGSKWKRLDAENLIKKMLKTSPSKGFGELFKIMGLKEYPTPSNPPPEEDAAYKKDTSFSLKTKTRNNVDENSSLIKPNIYHINFGKGNLTGVMNCIPNKRMALINRLKEDVERATKCDYDLLSTLRNFMRQQATTSRYTSKCHIAGFVRQYKRLALITLGNRRVEGGDLFYKRSEGILEELERFSGSTVPKELKNRAAEVLGMVFNPSVNKADSIVEQARKQLGVSSERIRNVTKKIKNSKSKNLKTKVSGRKKKKSVNRHLN